MEVSVLTTFSTLSLQSHKNEQLMYKQNIVAERLIHFKTWLKIKRTSVGEYSQHSLFHISWAERRKTSWDAAKSSCNADSSLLLYWCWWRLCSPCGEAARASGSRWEGSPAWRGWRDSQGLIPQPLRTTRRAAWGWGSGPSQNPEHTSLWWWGRSEVKPETQLEVGSGDGNLDQTHPGDHQASPWW